MLTVGGKEMGVWRAELAAAPALAFAETVSATSTPSANARR